VGTENQLADIFTKPLDEARFCMLKNELNVLDISNFTKKMKLSVDLVNSFCFAYHAYPK